MRTTSQQISLVPGWTHGGTITRRCDIPARRPVYFPVLTRSAPQTVRPLPWMPRARIDTALMSLSGVVSIVFGIVIFARPSTGALGTLKRPDPYATSSAGRRCGAQPQTAGGPLDHGDFSRVANCERAVTPSLGKIRYRCEPTVRCDMYSRSPISLLDMPSAASSVIWSSWGESRRRCRSADSRRPLHRRADRGRLRHCMARTRGGTGPRRPIRP
jgi:hypothetical protein